MEANLKNARESIVIPTQRRQGFWDPFKHLRVNGVHPHYKCPVHESCIDRSILPSPIRHVKRPTEQFKKFSVERFPRSHFTTRDSPDCVQYHPLYVGFCVLGNGITSDFVDLTQNNPMFCPPENQELFISSTEPDMPHLEDNLMTQHRRDEAEVRNPFEVEHMLPYLSPTSLFVEEEEAVKRRTASNWGGSDNGDNGSPTRQESLQRWQEQESECKTSQKLTTPIATTSKEPIAVPSPTSTTANNATNIRGKYAIAEIPRLGIQSNEANELAAKVSIPARPILPKPPGESNQTQRPRWNTSGLRPTQQQKKKK